MMKKHLLARWRLASALDEDRAPESEHSGSEEMGAWRDSLLEVDRRLRREACDAAAPSPERRARILAALHAEAEPADRRPRRITPEPTLLRGLVLAAASLLVLLLWDPFHVTTRSTADEGASTGAVVSRLLERLSAPAAASRVDPGAVHGLVDQPLRDEVDYLVADTTRVVEGVASSFNDTVIAPFRSLRGLPR